VLTAVGTDPRAVVRGQDGRGHQAAAVRGGPDE
jgi:hypothetical protein